MPSHPRDAFGASATRMLLTGLDALLAVLVVIAVIGGDGGPGVGARAVVGAVLVGVYGAGRVRLRTESESALDRRGRWWPGGAWMLALGVCWLALLGLGEEALWIAFPLMLVQMHVLGPRAGIAAVALTTATTIAFGVRDGVAGWGSIGGVLGPLVGAGVAVGVVLGLEALARESAARARMVEELTAAREFLAEAERARAVSGERERLAREIHDTLAQGFVSVDLLLRAARGTLPPGEAARLVDEAGATARANLEEARRFVRALAPADLAGSTLVEAVRRRVESVPGPTQATFHLDGQSTRLPLPVEAALLRITQSALANVTQHARAVRVDVTLTFIGTDVLLDVVDDGRGFTPGDTPRSGGGFGLRAIASRVRELGGDLAVESAPGEGTAVSVRLPVAAIPEDRSDVRAEDAVDVRAERPRLAAAAPVDEEGDAG